MYGDYLAPSAAQVFVGPLWIDDCYSIRFQAEDSTSPLFSYDQTHYAGIAPGKVLVSGSIAVYSRYPGYLVTAIQKASLSLINSIVTEDQNWNQQIRSKKNNEIAGWLNEMQSASTQDKFRLLQLAAQKGPDFLKRISDLSFYANKQYNKEGSGGRPIPHPHEIQKGSFNEVYPTTIWVYYDDLDERHFADKLEGVVFLGSAKALSGGANPGGDISASGAPILQIYPFLARRAVEMVITPQGWTPSDEVETPLPS